MIYHVLTIQLNGSYSIHKNEEIYLLLLFSETR